MKQSPHRSTQELASAVQPLLDRGLAHPEQPCHLLRRLAFPIVEQHRFARRVGERRDGRQQKASLLGTLQCFAGGAAPIRPDTELAPAS